MRLFGTKFFSLVFILSILVSCSTVSKGKMDEVAQRVKQQLEDVYHQKFTVKDVKYIPLDNAYKIEFYETDNPDISFYTKVDKNTNNVTFDTYNESVSNDKVTKWMVEPYIDKISNDWFGYGDISGGEPDPISYDTLKDYEKALSSNKKNALSFGAEISINMKITPQNVVNLLIYVYQLGKYVNSYNFKYIDLNVKVYTLPDGVTAQEYSSSDKDSYKFDKKDVLKATLKINTKDIDSYKMSSPMDLAKYLSIYKDNKESTLINDKPLYSKVNYLYYSWERKKFNNMF
ncbi:hypothetical protein [Francisella frigiditurris]|uniref:Putative lipoprotein n=1 Tax=Francisella frigiditurris TaxID=1542390 RepID=A0A1J0KT11_9GAMM|nr:hypothetical protein [Francisella frigiditurris]APC96835.1 putative lipoprotein [Francisella frigiditurris]